jgi:hypothetical protein
MTLSKGPTRTRLQVVLETDCPLLVRELNNDMKLPWSVPCRMWATARVVVFESRAHVGRQTNIETGDWVRVSQNVDEAFASSHADVWSKRDASGRSPE